MRESSFISSHLSVLCMAWSLVGGQSRIVWVRLGMESSPISSPLFVVFMKSSLVGVQSLKARLWVGLLFLGPAISHAVVKSSKVDYLDYLRRRPFKI